MKPMNYWKKAAVALMLAGFGSFGFSYQPASAMQHPVTIEDQGSFMAGGKTVTAPGTYDGTKPTDFAGETLHGDHAYVFYQKPVKAKKTSMVFLHGYGQPGKTWETTPDGRDGFQNIFLEKGYKTYVVDEPGRGKAGRCTTPGTVSAQPDDQLWFNTFRIGEWPDTYDNVAVPRTKEAEEQFFHAMTPDTALFDQQVVADAMTAVMDKAGDGVLVTHSAGGGPGWLTGIQSEHVKGIISLEPGAFPFPKGQAPAVEKTTSPFPATPMEVSMENFLKLTKIPTVIYFGDNIPKGDTPVANWGQDNWRVRWNLAKKWEAVMRSYGADVSVVSLPDIGIKGSTHFMMADLNNREVADAMVKWMHERKLDR